MVNKPNNKLSLEQLTEQQQVELQSRLPQGYLLSQYVEDVSTLNTEIDGLIKEGRESVEKQQYDSACTTFGDVSDLQDIYYALVQGQLPNALHMVEDLDTAVRDYMPTRLYDQLYRT